MALDGRIKPGCILLEVRNRTKLKKIFIFQVNDIPLDDYDSSQAIELLKLAIHQAIEIKGLYVVYF